MSTLHCAKDGDFPREAIETKFLLANRFSSVRRIEFSSQLLLDSLFFLAWGVWVFFRVLQESTLMFDLPPLEVKLVYVLCLGAVVAREVLSLATYGPRDVVYFSAMLLLGVSAFKCGDKSLLYAAIFIYSARSISFRRVAKFCLGALLAAFLYVQLLVFLDYISDGAIGMGTQRERSSMGFSWPSRAPNFVLTTTFLFVYLRGKKISYVELLACLVVGLAVYGLTDSRNPLVCTILLVVYVVFFVKVCKMKSCPTAMVMMIFLGCIVFSVGTAYFYNPSNPVLNELNSLMSNRLLYSHNAFEHSSLSLFGNPLYQATVNASDPLVEGYLDSSYLRLLFNYGAVAFCIVLTAYGILLRCACLNGDVILIGCLLVIVVHGIMEGQMLSLVYTPFLFMIGAMIYCGKPHRSLGV